MQSRIGWFAGFLVCALSLSAAAQVSQEVADASITAKIETLYLLNEHLNPFNIDTSTNNGVVTLTGGVNDDVQRNLAAELAATVEGVTQVMNNIIITPDAENDKDRRTWKQAIEDKGVSAAVRARLTYNGGFKGLSIGIETINNVTTLYGVVRSEEQRDYIARIASETKGVDQVVNNLTILEPTTSGNGWKDVGNSISDQFLEKRIEKTMLLNRHLSIRDLDVDVVSGTAVLTGSVNTEEQRKLAEEITRSLGGVQDVRNEIKLYDNVVEYGTPGAKPVTPAGEPVMLQDIDPTDESLPDTPAPAVEAKPLTQP
jgi:osmotically-inducible protein OsmY